MDGWVTFRWDFLSSGTRAGHSIFNWITTVTLEILVNCSMGINQQSRAAAMYDLVQYKRRGQR